MIITFAPAVGSLSVRKLTLYQEAAVLSGEGAKYTSLGRNRPGRACSSVAMQAQVWPTQSPRALKARDKSAMSPCPIDRPHNALAKLDNHQGQFSWNVHKLSLCIGTSPGLPA